MNTISVAVLFCNPVIIVDNATTFCTANAFAWPPKTTRPLSKAWCSIRLYYFIDLTGLAVPVLHSIPPECQTADGIGSWTHLHETIEPCNHLDPSTPPAWLNSLRFMRCLVGRAAFILA